jgi:AcrR family transcriptional regulator
MFKKWYNIDMVKSTYIRATNRNRRRIQEAFAELLSEKGSMQNITVTELADRADITRGTFYNYYNNLYEVGAELQGEIESQLFSAHSKLEGFSSVEEYIEAAFVFLKQQEPIYRELLTSKEGRGFLNKLENEISSRVLEVMHSNGIVDQKAELELLFLTNGTMAILRKYYLGEIDLTLPQIRDYLISKLRWLFNSYANQ